MDMVNQKRFGQTEMPDAFPSPQGKTFGIRAASWVIDMIILFLADIAIGFIAGIFLGIAFAVVGVDFDFVEDESQCITLINSLIVTLVYTVSFEWLYGATVGKLILGMRVIMIDGTPCDFKAAMVRGLFRYIDGLIFGLPAYVIMKEPPHQRWGDKSANTVVVSSKDAVISEVRDWWRLILAALIYSIITGIIMMISVLVKI